MKQSRSKSALFLIELIAAIFFFSVSSAVCIQLFAKAQVVSRRSAALDNAMLRMESCAEAYTAAGGELSALEGYMGGKAADGEMVAYFDRGFSPCEEAAAFYVLTAAETREDGGLRTLALRAVETNPDGAELFALRQSVYVPPDGA